MRLRLVVTVILASLLSPSTGAETLSGSLKVVGTIQYGQTMQATYTSNVVHVGLKFYGNRGDSVGVFVHSVDGDPLLWVTDASFKILAFNDDATNTTVDSHVSLVLPPNSNPDNKLYWIVMREYSRQNATFSVKLSKDTRLPPLQDLSHRSKRH